MPDEELKTKQILVNVTETMLAEIDEARFESRTASRNDWIREALQERLDRQEKLEREKKGRKV